MTVNFRPSLDEILIEYGLDKPANIEVTPETGPVCTDKKTLSYSSKFYEPWFSMIRKANIKITLVEIGSMFGGSLMLWEKYFPNANIVGIDPAPHHEYNVPSKVHPGEITAAQYIEEAERITFYKEDAYDKNFVDSQFKDNSCDIIIDDGPHGCMNQTYAAELYYKKLKVGGVLVIEDIWDTHRSRLYGNIRDICGYGNIISWHTCDRTRSTHANIVAIQKLTNEYIEEQYITTPLGHPPPHVQSWPSLCPVYRYSPPSSSLEGIIWSNSDRYEYTENANSWTLAERDTPCPAPSDKWSIIMATALINNSLKCEFEEQHSA